MSSAVARCVARGHGRSLRRHCLQQLNGAEASGELRQLSWGLQRLHRLPSNLSRDVPDLLKRPDLLCFYLVNCTTLCHGGLAEH